MVKSKANHIATSSAESVQGKEGFFTRFYFAFESLFIVLLISGGLWLSHFFNLPQVVDRLLTSFPSTQLSEIVTYASITLLGLFFLLIRFSLYLRQKMQKQFVAEEDIRRLAFFDSLTNLPNEELCHNRLEHALARAARNNTSIAVLSISINNFNTVNEQLGHEGGDKLIKQIAKRLSGQLRSGDTLARITGVKFLIILETVEEKESINLFAEQVNTKLIKCYRIAMREFYITCNMGISIYPTDGEHSKELLKQADTAMCFAKEQGRNQLAFFSKALQEQINTKHKIAQQLREAMNKNEFFLHYQPIISASDNHVIAVEVLLRWHNELLGDISPNVFIPIAEEIGIITEIGHWVLESACQQNKAWQRLGFSDLVVSINLSVMQFGIMNYAETISLALKKTELSPQFLELEFTEKTLMKDSKESITQLRQLAALGVSISLDDFGTGFSSIKYLTRFKLNKIKIDGSFINGLPESKANVIAVKGIISLAQQLGFHITAESVETEKQQEFLLANQVDSLQGYLYSRPVDSKACEELLKSPPWINIP